MIIYGLQTNVIQCHLDTQGDPFYRFYNCGILIASTNVLTMKEYSGNCKFSWTFILSLVFRLWPLREKFAQIVQICWNLLAEIPPFADFLKSATADLLKSAGRIPPPFAYFLKFCHCRFAENCWQKSPLLSLSLSLSGLPIFLKSATIDLLKSAGRIPPPLQIYWNLQAESPSFFWFARHCG